MFMGQHQCSYQFRMLDLRMLDRKVLRICIAGCVTGVMLILEGCVSNLTRPYEAGVDSYNLSPASRILSPAAVLRSYGQIDSANAVLSSRATKLTGQGSYLVLDFGKEVGGIVTLRFGAASDKAQTLALAFSESSLYTGLESDQSNSLNAPDGSLSVNVTPYGQYVMPAAALRGAFRYLTIGLMTSGSVEVDSVRLHFTAAPALSDLRAYSGSFQSSDDLLNRIWYAGAYTVQMDTIDPSQGRVWPPPASGWQNNGVSGSGTTILTDGAKRDRLVWPGDLGISALTAYLSTGDTLSVKNDLETLFAHQDAAGGLPYVGPEVNSGTVSDTYHLWTLNAVVDYYLYSGDRAWLIERWPQLQRAIQFSTAKIDAHGLFTVTLTEDWGRQVPGGEEISANSLLFHVLQGAGYLATVVGDSASATLYDNQANSLRAAIQSLLWDSSAGLYRDIPGSSLYPQDGNAMALWFGVPDSASVRSQISASLRRRWNSFGAVSPERPGSIATFPGSMEVLAHFAAGEDSNALDLIRLEWGYMLASPLGTGSSFWEGYLQDGSFDYGGPYMSLAHGWATGPTAALTQYVAGIAPGLSSAVQFHFIPHLGGLSHVSATLPLPQGTIAVSWSYVSGRLTAIVNAPASMVGRYGVPVSAAPASVFVDGRLVWSSCTAVSVSDFGEIVQIGNYIYLNSIAGSHTVMAINNCGQ